MVSVPLTRPVCGTIVISSFGTRASRQAAGLFPGSHEPAEQFDDAADLFRAAAGGRPAYPPTQF